MKKLATSFALVAALGCGPALAQGWYAGLGIGQGTVDFGSVPGGVTVDDKDTTYQVRFGYRFHPNLAVELGYYHLGDYGLTAGSGAATLSASAEARSFGVALVGILPLDRFDLYGRVGFARSELKASGSFGGFSASDRDRENEWYAGVGGRFNVSREIGVFAEYQRHDKLEIDGYFVGVDLRF